MLIPLKHKYLHTQKGKYKGGENFAPKKKRTKLGHDKHVARFGEPVPRARYVDGATGKSVMGNY